MREGAAVLLIAGAGLAAISPGAYLQLVHPGRLNPDNALYEQVTAAVAVHRPEMLIAHRGLNFYYQYRTMGEAFPYKPEPHWPRERVWRVTYGIKPAEFAYYLPPESLWNSSFLFDLPDQYALIREDRWEAFRRGVEGSGDEELKDRVLRLWLNPNEPRPAFLYQKHRPRDEQGEFGAFPD